MSQSRSARYEKQLKQQQQQLNLVASAPKRRKVPAEDVAGLVAPQNQSPPAQIHHFDLAPFPDVPDTDVHAVLPPAEEDFPFVAAEPFDFFDETIDNRDTVALDKYGNPILSKEDSSTVLLAMRSVFHFLNFKKKQAKVTITLINAIQKAHSKEPIVSSQYMLDKSRRTIPLNEQHLCPDCGYAYTALAQVKCPNGCKTPRLDSKGNPTAKCLIASLETNFKFMCTRENYVDECMEYMRTAHLNPDTILQDGIGAEKWQELKRVLGDVLGQDSQLVIPTVVSTDGGLLFKRNNIQVWPLWGSFLCRDPSKRFAQNELCLLGLWVGRNKPPMNSFLKNFVSGDLIQKKTFIVHREGKPAVTCHPVLFALSADIPARSAIANSSGQSSSFPCYHCHILQAQTDRGIHHYHHNWKTEDGLLSPLLNLRTQETIEQDQERLRLRLAEYAREGNAEAQPPAAVRGIAGPSIVHQIPHISIPNDIVVDPMHELFNLFRELGSLLFDKEHENDRYSLYQHVNSIQKDMLSLRIPHSKSEPPRGILLRDKWKAAEWRFFFFYLLLPILDKYYSDTQQIYKDHLALLISALRCFSANQIFRDAHPDIPPGIITHEGATQRLYKFVQKMEHLYGADKVTLSVHLLLHLPRLVLRYGPLWTVSCFPFESAMHWILRYCHGRKAGFMQSMFAAYTENLDLLSRLQELNLDETDPYYDVFSALDLGAVLSDSERIPATYHKLEDPSLKATETCFGVGKAIVGVVGTHEYKELDGVLRLIDVPAGETIRVFKKLSLRGRLYCSTEYDHNYVTRRDSRAFVFINGHGQECAAVADFYFYCVQSKSAYAAARMLSFNGNNALQNPKYDRCVFYADQLTDYAPRVVVGVANMVRRLIMLDFHSRCGGKKVLALSEFIYVVPGLEAVARVNPQLQGDN